MVSGFLPRPKEGQIPNTYVKPVFILVFPLPLKQFCLLYFWLYLKRVFPSTFLKIFHIHVSFVEEYSRFQINLSFIIHPGSPSRMLDAVPLSNFIKMGDLILNHKTSSGVSGYFCICCQTAAGWAGCWLLPDIIDSLLIGTSDVLGGFNRCSTVFIIQNVIRKRPLHVVLLFKLIKALNLKKMCASISWRAVIRISNDHYGNTRFCSCCTVLTHMGFTTNLSPSLSALFVSHSPTRDAVTHTKTHICTLTHSSFATPTTGSWQNALRRPPKWQQLSWPGIFWAQVKNVAQHKGPVPPPPQPLYSLETKPGSVAWSVRLDLWIEPAIQQW